MDDFLLSHHGFYFHAFLQLIYFHSFNCYDEKLVPYKVIDDIQEDVQGVHPPNHHHHHNRMIFSAKF